MWCLSSHSGELYIHRLDGKIFVTKPDLSERVNYSWGWNQLVVRIQPAKMVAAAARVCTASSAVKA